MQTMKKTHLLAFTIFGQILLASSLVVNLPLRCNGRKDLLVNSLKCPLPSTEVKVDGKVKVYEGDICRPQINAKDVEAGYLCHKDIYKAICDETWYFSATVKHEIEHAPISDIECIEGLTELKLGIVPNPQFPSVDCYWNARTEEKRTYIILTQHDPALDPYSNKIKDNVVDPDCDFNLCKTNFINTKWIRDKNTTEIERCDAKNWDCHPYKIYQGWISKSEMIGWGDPTQSYSYTGLVLDSHIYGHIPMSKLCHKTFCGKEGYLFPDKSWWQIRSKTPASPLFRELTLNGSRSAFPDCETIKTYGYAEVEEDESSEIIRESAEIRHEMCLETLSTLASGYEASFRDLMKFIPQRPGPGKAYSLNSNGKPSYYNYHWAGHPASSASIQEQDCYYYLVDIPKIQDDGILNITGIGNTDVCGKLLVNGSSMTLNSLGFKIDHHYDDHIVETGTDVHDEMNIKERMVWIKPDKIHPLLWVGPNGIVIDHQHKQIHFPVFSRGVDRIPHYWTQKHRVVKYRHATQLKIYKQYLDNPEKSNPYDFNAWTGRHVNRTEIPVAISNWFSGVKDTVFDKISKIGSWLKWSFYLCFIFVLFKGGLLVWNKYKTLRHQTKRTPKGKNSQDPEKLDIFGQTV
ncbi:G protein [Ekpoma virus 2]|uniref:G protein n=1 Tax=Ekpoma virus 2 TaxID=1987021 RepID=A0A0C5C390_9RHAB|nr:G protein [Ekpoma virus 2]AJN08923.1 G protein [Ekpoma virus 2]